MGLSRPMNTTDKISAAQLAVFSIYLVCGVFLCLKHGFGRGGGYLYIIILSLARIIGDAMLLATLNDATNTSLYIGWAVLNGIGLTILILVMIGLLNRLFESLNGTMRHPFNSLYHRAIQIMMLAALILQIVGGTDATYQLGSANGSAKVTYPAESKAGMAITLAAFLLVLVEEGWLFIHRDALHSGEHRIMFGILVSIPFVCVRLAYSGYIIWGEKRASPWLTLGMSVLMEIIVILIYVVIGFISEKKQPKAPQRDQEQGFKLNNQQPLRYEN